MEWRSKKYGTPLHGWESKSRFYPFIFYVRFLVWNPFSINPLIFSFPGFLTAFPFRLCIFMGFPLSSADTKVGEINTRAEWKLLCILKCAVRFRNVIFLWCKFRFWEFLRYLEYRICDAYSLFYSRIFAINYQVLKTVHDTFINAVFEIVDGNAVFR